MSEEERYRKLAEKLFMGHSELVARLFAVIANPEEADLMLALPATASDAAEKLGEDRESVQEMLDLLFHKGLVFKKDQPDGPLYRMCRDIAQFHDASILWPEAPQEYLDLWQEFMEKDWPAFSEMVAKVLPKAFTRVVPVSESVDARQQVLAFEDVSEMINASGTIAVTGCTCRLIAHKCDRPIEICIQLGKAADYAIERGTGRKIDEDEAMRLLRVAEEAGLVHVTMNKSSDFHIICNCCNDCCMTFGMLGDRRLNLCDPSRFAATIDAELCDGCGSCVERCYFGAVELDRDAQVAVVDPEACMGCGLCQLVCPSGALNLVVVREADFVPS